LGIGDPDSRLPTGYNPPVRIVSSAPTRIDLAGGTIDIWPLYLFHDGALTLNAAISLRAHCEIDSRTDGAIELRSIDTNRTVRANRCAQLDSDSDLALLAHLARHYTLENATLTTRGESPAGAGIAGSSALTIAVCGALARWTQQSCEPEHILQIAMNCECQTIKVPTGVQDYRPALYGGVAAIELGVAGIRRVGLDVDPADLEQRIVLAYTGAPRNSGTNNWEITKRHTDGDRHVFDCFERIRDTAAAMRTALDRGDWDEVGRQIAVEWDNRKRLAPGVTTPVIDELMARAQAAGATAAKVCGAGGGGCLFCYGPPDKRADIATALAAGGARVLDYRIETEGLRLG
jgi:D-glycero-alpha-D-manno-heptose-7-phosphate kinase